MKTLDFKAIPAAIAQAAVAVKAAVSRKPAKPTNRDAADELRRRAEVNARGAAARGDLDRALFGGRSSWIPARPGWLDRGR